MATTTNYSWTTPDDTALVKDGASAIRALGTAIDTSMNTALGTKKAGLVLLQTQTLSAVSSVSFTSQLNSTYDNYKVVYSLTLASAGDVFMRLRSGSTDATTSDYTAAVLGTNNATVSAGRATNTYWYTNQIATATEFSGIYDLFNPFKAQVTSGISGQYVATGTTVYFNSANLRHNLTTSYDGFTIYSSVNMTGSASLYGYNK